MSTTFREGQTIFFWGGKPQSPIVEGTVTKVGFTANTGDEFVHWTDADGRPCAHFPREDTRLYARRSDIPVE